MFLSRHGKPAFGCTVAVFGLLTSVASAQQTPTERVFDNNVGSPSPWPFALWAPKGVMPNEAECVSGGVVVGLSASPTSSPQFIAHSLLCAAPGSASYSFTQTDPPQYETNEATYYSDSPDYGHHPINGNPDWDYGYLKSECPVGDAIIGLSQGDATRGGGLDVVMCSSPLAAQCYGNPNVGVSNQTCHAVAFPGDHPSNNSSRYGEWSPNFYKLACNLNEVMVGVSKDTSYFNPHAILCCGLSSIIC